MFFRVVSWQMTLDGVALITGTNPDVVEVVYSAPGSCTCRRLIAFEPGAVPSSRSDWTPYRNWRAFPKRLQNANRRIQHLATQIRVARGVAGLKLMDLAHRFH